MGSRDKSLKDLSSEVVFVEEAGREEGKKPEKEEHVAGYR